MKCDDFKLFSEYLHYTLNEVLRLVTENKEMARAKVEIKQQNLQHAETHKINLPHETIFSSSDNNINSECNPVTHV